MKDLRGKDLSHMDEEELRDIGPFIYENSGPDRMEQTFGATWYKQIDMAKFKAIVISSKVFCQKLNEWGVVYSAFIGRGTLYPTLMVCYNIEGGGKGARCVEFLDLKFEGDGALLSLN